MEGMKLALRNGGSLMPNENSWYKWFWYNNLGRIYTVISVSFIALLLFLKSTGYFNIIL